MNIREFRAITDDAFRAEGFNQQALHKGGYKVWALPSAETIRFFAPDAQRRPWGFALKGLIGFDIVELRRWLNEHKPGRASGIFRSGFVGYYSTNDDVFADLSIGHDTPVPADLWAGLIKDRLDRIPQTVDELLETYRCNREALGWLAHPNEKAAWDFLIAWRSDPDPRLRVPYSLPTGQIAYPDGAT